MTNIARSEVAVKADKLSLLSLVLTRNYTYYTSVSDALQLLLFEHETRTANALLPTNIKSQPFKLLCCS